MYMFDRDRSYHTPHSYLPQVFISQFPEDRLPAVRDATLEHMKIKFSVLMNI